MTDNRRGKRSVIKLVLLLAVSLSFTAWLDPFRDEVSRGNGRYHDRKYDEAGKHYKKAEEYAPGEEARKKLSFNKGNAQFMKGEYRKALDSYRMSLRSGDKDVQKKSFFNMGNTYMKMNKNKEAVESFINALKIDPAYEKAKRNIEYLLSKKQKQKEQDKKNKDSDKNNKEKNKNPQDRQENKKGEKNKKDRAQNKTVQKKMNREQLKSLLESMKKKPVRRQKGNPGGRRYLEKQW